jgi:signal transduction histidine kinase
MDLGHEIIREQLFFRKELRERVFWFIKLRWAAVAFGTAGLLSAPWVGVSLPTRSILLILAVLGVANLGFSVAGRRLEAEAAAQPGPYEIFAHVQISLDLLCLFLLLALTGGSDSPLCLLVVFHVALAGILLSPRSCYLYAGLIVIGLAGLFIMKRAGLIPPWSALEDSGAGFWRWLALVGTVVVLSYLVTSIKKALRYKGRELMKVSRDLEVSNAKLTSLYEMIKDVNRCREPRQLMDAATRNAARIMGVKACSIKLLDAEGACLRFASTHGLSENYTAKGWIRVDKSQVNQSVIEGRLYTIGNVDRADSFQYPEDIDREGIKSLLCLPLSVDRKTLGVFCVYSGQSNYFTDRDADFFSLMTDLTALAMERLNREVAKTWFMNKAAHQLRSPLGAVQSMLSLLQKGYLGSLDDRQAETIDRSQVRLGLLKDTVNDLLKLAAEREAPAEDPASALDAGAALEALIPMYRVAAEAKGLGLECCITGGLPEIASSQETFDEIASNLISNAVKYTTAGRVEVGLFPGPPGFLALEIKDTGIGIALEDRDKLFSEFFRGRNAKAVTEEGTGLGLAIVKKALEILGGDIQVDSQPGRGTTVLCLLPLAGSGRTGTGPQLTSEY